MKNILVTLVFLVFVTSIPAQILSNRPDNFEVTAENYIDFIPIAPIQVNGGLTVASSSDKIEVTTLQMSMDKQSVLNFCNESMETTIQSFSRNGEVNYLYSGRSVSKGTYRLIIDYNKYIIQTVKGTGDDNCVGYAKLGLG